MKHLLSDCCVLPSSEGRTPLGWCGGLQLLWLLVRSTQRPHGGLPGYLQGPTPLRQPGGGGRASLDLGMWAGQSGAGWPGVGRRQSRAAGQLTAKATQGRGLDS